MGCININVNFEPSDINAKISLVPSKLPRPTMRLANKTIQPLCSLVCALAMGWEGFLALDGDFIVDNSNKYYVQRKKFNF